MSASDVPDIRDIPGSPDVPDIPGSPNVPGIPGIPGSPDVPGSRGSGAAPGTPVIMTPDIGRPGSEAPRTGASRIPAPGTGTPEIRTPDIRTPEIEAPEIGTPGMRAPGSGTSEIRIPEIGTPEIEAPEIRTAGNRTAGNRTAGIRTAGNRTAGILAPGSGTPRTRPARSGTASVATAATAAAGSAMPGDPGDPGDSSDLVPPGIPPSRRRTRGVLGTELRRGVGPWAAGAVVVVCWVTMYGKSPQWMGRWAETTDLLRVAALLLCGPLAVAVGCWQGGRERRRGTGDLLASLPRAPLRRTLLAVSPAALWPPAGYLLAAAGCALATWPYAAGGGPFLSLVAADAVALAALGVLGFVAGRLIPWRPAAPLLAVVTYVGLGVPMYADSPARWLDPALNHAYVWDRPVWWFGPASMVWTAGLAGAALLAYAARRRISALPPLAAACAAAVLLAGAGDRLWRPDPAAARLVCDDGAPRVCVTAVDGKLLPSVSAALAGLNAQLRGVPGAPVRWVNGPRAPGPGREQLADAPGVVVREVGKPVLLRPREAQLPDPFGLSEHGEISDPALYANWAVGYLFSQDCSGTDVDTPAARRATAVNDAVNQWLAPRPDSAGVPLYGGEVHLRRLRAMDREESRAYLARYLAADLCRAEEVPVP